MKLSKLIISAVSYFNCIWFSFSQCYSGNLVCELITSSENAFPNPNALLAVTNSTHVQAESSIS